MRNGFLDKVIERLDRIDPKSLNTHFLRLAHERGLLEAIFQSLQEGIIVLDANGRISYANAAIEKLMGVSPDAVHGHPIARYLRDIDWERILDFDDADWSKMITYEIEVNYPARKFLSFYVVPLPTDPGEEKAVLLMLRDITRDREQEAGLLESERLNAVRLLAAGVAHEIGNPLNALNIHLQLIDREVGRLDSDKRDSIRNLLCVARNEVQRLDAIITQFLQAVRPAKPRFVLSEVPDVLQDTLTLFKHEIESRGLKVEIESPAILPKIRLDPQQMKQAFFNIIKNAFQAMADKGSLTVALSASDRYVEISFRDDGSGIAHDEIGQIFEPYHTTKSEGSGLGLMIVQRIVQDHGGAIEVHSSPGAGTTVTVLLPLVERQLRLLRSSSPSAPDEAAGTAAPAQVER